MKKFMKKDFSETEIDRIVCSEKNYTVPDYHVIPTAKDLAEGKNAEFNFTIDSIRKKFLKYLVSILIWKSAL